MQNKIEIIIVLDDIGNVKTNSTSQNLITVLGMLSTAEAIYKSQLKRMEEKPQIIVPELRLPNNGS